MVLKYLRETELLLVFIPFVLASLTCSSVIAWVHFAWIRKRVLRKTIQAVAGALPSITIVYYGACIKWNIIIFAHKGNS